MDTSEIDQLWNDIRAVRKDLARLSPPKRNRISRPHVGINRTCKGCGKPFVATAPSQHYCSSVCYPSNQPRVRKPRDWTQHPHYILVKTALARGRTLKQIGMELGTTKVWAGQLVKAMGLHGLLQRRHKKLPVVNLTKFHPMPGWQFCCYCHTHQPELANNRRACKKCVAARVNQIYHTPEGKAKAKAWQKANADKTRKYSKDYHHRKKAANPPLR
jgi:hypothetical protein